MFSSSDTFRFAFATVNSSGAATNADSTPAGTLVVNGSNSGATVTISNAATGEYRGSVSLSGLAVGDEFYVRYTATVGGVTQFAFTATHRIGAVPTATNADGKTIATTDHLNRLAGLFGDAPRFSPPSRGLVCRVAAENASVTSGRVDSVTDTVTGGTVTASGSARPYYTSDLGGNPAMRFDGAQVMSGLAGITFDRQNLVLVAIAMNTVFARDTTFNAIVNAGSTLNGASSIFCRSSSSPVSRSTFQVLNGTTYMPDETATTTPAAPLSHSPTMIAVVQNASAQRLIVDDFEQTQGPRGSGTSAGLTVGAFAGPSNYFRGYVFEVLAYTAAEFDADLEKQLRDYCWQRYGCGRAPDMTVFVIGDSISGSYFGYTSSPVNPLALWTYNMAANNRGVKVVNLAVGGAQLGISGTDDFVTTFANRIAPLVVHDSPHALLIFGGTNDLASGATGAATYGYATSLRTLWLAAGGDYTAIATMLPRNGLESGWNAYNTLIRANSAGFDYVADLTLRPEFNAHSDQTNTLVFSDGIHPTEYGQSRMLSTFQAAFEAAGDKLIGRFTPTQVGYVDAAVSSRSTYAAADTAGTTTLLSRLTGTRAGYLDKLNVSGTLLNTANVTVSSGKIEANVVEFDGVLVEIAGATGTIGMARGATVSSLTAQQVADEVSDALDDRDLTEAVVSDIGVVKKIAESR